MLKWEKIQTKTEAEFAFSYVLKALDGSKIERLFTSEMIGGPRLDENEAVYTLLEGKLYIQFDNQMCLILYYTAESEIYELEYRLLTEQEIQRFNSFDDESKDLFHTHIDVYDWLFDENGNRIEESFKIRTILDVQLQYDSIKQIIVHGFHHEFEKWVYKGGYLGEGSSHELITIPAGGDYFGEIEFVLCNGATISVAGEPAMYDGYFDVWCSGPKHVLYLKDRRIED